MVFFRARPLPRYHASGENGRDVLRRAQGRRDATAPPPVSRLARLRSIAAVWTFFALRSIWADASIASFGQRVSFFLARFRVR